MNPNTPHPKPRVSHRGIYLLPNFFTTCCLLMGFLSIICSASHRFDLAAPLIIAAALADTLDGRIARLTHTQTQFGAEYDSLSDMVSFGVAPGLLFYFWSFHRLGTTGYFFSFLYVACVALRLARFNVTKVSDQRFFIGLPCTCAASLVASFAWLVIDRLQHHQHLHVLIHTACLVLMIGLSALMVSSIRYFSFKKKLDLKINFLTLMVMVMMIGFWMIDPLFMMFITLFVYSHSGFFLWIQKKRFFTKITSPSTQKPSKET